MISLALATKASTFLKGLAQKCVVAAVKKWKESSDAAKAEQTTKAIDEFEAGKSVATKVEQRITASLRNARLTTEQVERLLAFESNPAFTAELTNHFLNSDLSETKLVAL